MISDIGATRLADAVEEIKRTTNGRVGYVEADVCFEEQISELMLQTVEQFGTHLLMATTPFVMYGVFRFFFLVHLKTGSGDPSKLFVTDRPMLINGFLWCLAVCAIVYAPAELLPWWAVPKSLPRLIFWVI